MQHTTGVAMSENRMTYDGSRITIGADRWEAPVPVLDAARVGELAILVLDWTPLSKNQFGQAQNLRAYTLDGREVWTAEHPTSGTADCYTKIARREPLVVHTFAGYDCRIEPSSGRLLESVFTK